MVERKLTEHGVKKIIPTKAVLAETYRTFARGREVEKFFKRELRKLDSAKVTVPADLPQQVEAYLRQHPTERWDAAVAAIVKKSKGLSGRSARRRATSRRRGLCCGDVFSGAETTSV